MVGFHPGGKEHAGLDAGRAPLTGLFVPLTSKAARSELGFAQETPSPGPMIAWMYSIRTITMEGASSSPLILSLRFMFRRKKPPPVARLCSSNHHMHPSSSLIFSLRFMCAPRIRRIGKCLDQVSQVVDTCRERRKSAVGPGQRPRPSCVDRDRGLNRVRVRPRVICYMKRHELDEKV